MLTQGELRCTQRILKSQFPNKPDRPYLNNRSGKSSRCNYQIIPNDTQSQQQMDG
jgi:hypothetical protein